MPWTLGMSPIYRSKRGVEKGLDMPLHVFLKSAYQKIKILIWEGLLIFRYVDSNFACICLHSDKHSMPLFKSKNFDFWLMESSLNEASDGILFEAWLYPNEEKSWHQVVTICITSSHACQELRGIWCPI